MAPIMRHFPILDARELMVIAIFGRPLPNMKGPRGPKSSLSTRAKLTTYFLQPTVVMVIGRSATTEPSVTRSSAIA